jgi:hypothetical protein
VGTLHTGAAALLCACLSAGALAGPLTLTQIADFSGRGRALAQPASEGALVEAVGIDVARGVGHLRSLPPPSDRTALGRQFGDVWRRFGTSASPTAFPLEGCLAVQVPLQAAASLRGEASAAQLLSTAARR